MLPLVQLIMKNSAKWLDLKGTCRYLFPRVDREPGRRSSWYVAASRPYARVCPPQRNRHWHGGHGRPPWPRDWPAGGRLSCSWQQGPPPPWWLRPLACTGPWFATGPSVFSPTVWTVFQTPLAVGPRAVFPPAVALPGVRLACQ